MTNDIRDHAFGLTLCTAPGRVATKRLYLKAGGELAKVQAEPILRWEFRPVRFRDLDELAARLTKLASEPHRMIIRGAPRRMDFNPQQRLWAREPATLYSVDRQWVAIDVDDACVPQGLGNADKLVEAGIHIRDSMLPCAFRGARMVVTPSASTGLKGPEKARCRLFGVLDRCVSDVELKRWARGAKAKDMPVDHSLFQAGQPHYTARPLFTGLSDPVPEHLWATVLPGDFDEIKIDLDEFTPELIAIERRLERWTGQGGRNWRVCLEEELGGPAGFYEPLKRGLGMAASSSDPDEEVVAVACALVAARADTERQRHYDRQWIESALRSFRQRTQTAMTQDNEARADLEALFQNNRVRQL